MNLSFCFISFNKAAVNLFFRTKIAFRRGTTIAKLQIIVVCTCMQGVRVNIIIIIKISSTTRSSIKINAIFHGRNLKIADKDIKKQSNSTPRKRSI